MPSEESTVYNSYFDAFKAAKMMASPVTPDKSKASTTRYKASPSPSPKKSYDFAYDPVPKKPVSVLHRPVKPMTMKNVENIDVQFEKDKQAFEKHANSYRRLQTEPWHHNRSPNSIITLWEAGHIVDKGRGKSDVELARGIYDPIINQFKVPPSPSKTKRPQSAPPARPSSAGAATYSPQRQDKALQDTRGEYNPITHQYKKAVSKDYEAQKKKEFERAHGGRGITSRSDKDGSFDPITGQYKPFSTSSGPRTPPRPSSAPRPVRSTSPDTSRTGHSRTKQMQGDSWGTYNPINHSWSVEPRDAKYKEQNNVLNREQGISGNQLRKSGTSERQGIYNPILNHWVVPPANPRVIAGLSFAPATLFSKVTAATLRV